MSKSLVFIVHLLIFGRVMTSSFLEDEINEVDNVLSDFFAALSMSYLRYEEPWYIVAVSKSTSSFHDSLNPYFQSHPMVLCSSLRPCSYPRGFISSILFLVLLDDLTYEKIGILSSCASYCKLIFVLRNDSTTPNDRDGLNLFRLIAARRDFQHGEFFHVKKDSVQHYSASISDDCSMQVDPGFVWKAGMDLMKMSGGKLFGLRDHKGCVMTVAATPYMSKVVAEKDEDGSYRILGGRDGMLVLMIAKRLNSTVVFKHSEALDALTTALMVAFGTADFTITRIPPKEDKSISFLMTFDDECVTWAVPRITKSSYDVVVSEFPWDVWALVGLVFVVGCGLSRIPRSFIIMRNDRRSSSGFVEQILDLVSIHVGIPVTRDPVTVGGKMVFLGYLCYATVMTTAYKTSLASIMSTIKSTPTITDVRGIIEANLTAGGSGYHKFLIEQFNEDDVPWQLMNRFEIYNNHSEAMDRLETDEKFVYLASLAALTWDKEAVVRSQRLIKFDILDKCAVKYAASMEFSKESRLIEPVYEIILRVFEFGLLDYWDHTKHVHDDVLESLNADRFFGQDTMQKLISAFIFYFACLAVAAIVFLAEIMTLNFTH